MATWLIALVIGAGAGAWVWNRLMRQTGRQDTSAILAGATVVVVFLFLVTLFKFFFHF